MLIELRDNCSQPPLAASKSEGDCTQTRVRDEDATSACKQTNHCDCVVVSWLDSGGMVPTSMLPSRKLKPVLSKTSTFAVAKRAYSCFKPVKLERELGMVPERLLPLSRLDWNG